MRRRHLLKSVATAAVIGGCATTGKKAGSPKDTAVPDPFQRGLDNLRGMNIDDHVEPALSFVVKT